MEVRGREENKRGLGGAAEIERETWSYRVGSPDPNAAAEELLSILLSEGEEQDNYNDNNEIEWAQVFLSSSSSPPSRPANPMVRDPMFGDKNPIEPFLLWASGPTGSTSSSSRKVCRSRKLEIQLPASRIEGFDLLDRERSRRRRGITSFA